MKKLLALFIAVDSATQFHADETALFASFRRSEAGGGRFGAADRDGLDDVCFVAGDDLVDPSGGVNDVGALVQMCGLLLAVERTNWGLSLSLLLR